MNFGGERHFEIDLDFDEVSAINSRRDKGYSFAGASESEIAGHEAEGEGGNRDNVGERDYDLDELADVLGIQNMQRLQSIMQMDSNRDQEAFMGALGEAIDKASQGGNNLIF